MSGVIRKISDADARKITTAQVVSNISDAIRQLLDNSLDAGATIIDVRCMNHGFDAIEVDDNGCGIAAEDLDALCQPHSTSKLRDIGDLTSLLTLGFRGEALHALAVLSRLSILTRSSKDAIGTRLEYNEHAVAHTRVPTPRQIGTTVTVSELFHLLPVRRKDFSRKAKKEFLALLRVIQEFALLQPQIKFSCSNTATNGGKQQFISTPGKTANIKDVITSLFGSSAEKEHVVELTWDGKLDEEIAQMMSVEAVEVPDIKISGFISSCAHSSGRSSADRQFVYVNRRPIDHSKICRAANEVYQQFNKGSFPLLVLYLEVAPDAVEVNITPDKRTVFFTQERLILASIRTAVLKTLTPLLSQQANVSVAASSQKIVSIFNFPGYTKSTLAQQDVNNFQRAPGGLPVGVPSVFEVAKPTQPSESQGPTSASQNFVPSGHILFNSSRELASASEPDVMLIEGGANNSNPKLKITFHKPNFENMNKSAAGAKRPKKGPASTQLDGNSVLAFLQNLKRKTPDDFNGSSQRSIAFDADMHDSVNAERELDMTLRKTDFEQMSIIGQFNRGFILAQLKGHVFIIDQHAADEKHNFEQLQKRAIVESQRLIKPMLLNLGAVPESSLRNNIDIFKANGFEIDFPEDSGARLISVPILSKFQFDRSDIDEILAEVTEHPGEMYRPQKLRKILASKACRKSVMVGDALEMRQMQLIIAHLGKLNHPWNCPHGRPTMRHLYDSNK